DYVGAIGIFSSGGQSVCRTRATLWAYAQNTAHDVKSTRPNPVHVARSAAQGPQEAAGDDVALNFAGAVPDALYTGIAPDAFQRQVAHESHAAVYLQRFIGHHRQHF